MEKKDSELQPAEDELLLTELTALPSETEWAEFKCNYAEPDKVGAYISALSNSAALHDKPFGYLVWGIEDVSRRPVGTAFQPRKSRVGQQELENYLATQLCPRVDFRFREFIAGDRKFVILHVPKATHMPVSFKNVEYVRVGTYMKKLKEFPEKERALWALFSRNPFESSIAMEAVSADTVLSLIDYPGYFELTAQRLPDNRGGILQRLASENIIVSRAGGRYDITNLGGILFAKRLDCIESLSRKVLRVIIYDGTSRVKTIREQTGTKGYATGFEGAVGFVRDQLPENEEIRAALRAQVKMYPEIAIRELVANALIHQDFTLTGTGPMVEIFSDRIEITNPGVPLIDTMRIFDEPPRSRNESLAAFMRRLNICEERGSGIDKVIFNVEVFQLPAPDFIVTADHTRAVLFAHRKLADMDRRDRIRACYQHACLKYVSHDMMTNASLRHRFAIKESNYATASRIIADTRKAALIRRYDPESRSRKHAKYVPFWA